MLITPNFVHKKTTLVFCLLAAAVCSCESPVNDPVEKRLAHELDSLKRVKDSIDIDYYSSRHREPTWSDEDPVIMVRTRTE